MQYTNGKIYKIWNLANDEIYVGSTTQALSKRMAEHRVRAKDVKQAHLPLYRLMCEIGIESFYIELLETCPCNSIEELHKMEGKYIRELGTLNKQIPGRTLQEYRKAYNEQNKDKITEYKKAYNEHNKDKISEYEKAWHEQNKDKIAETSR